MAIVNFVRQLFAGQFDFFGVDDDYIVAAVQVRDEIRLVLAAQNLGDFGGKSAQYDTAGINDIPFSFDVRWLGCVSVHIFSLC